jgi:hypothetical protein
MVEKKEYKLKEFKGSITLIVELELDAGDLEAQDDKYTLYCSEDESIYKKTLNVRDDHVEGDKFLTLAFPGLVKDHRYTLEVNPGAAGNPYYVFEDVPLEELSDQIRYESGEPEEEEISDDVEVSDEEPDVVYEWLVGDEPLPESYRQDDDLDEDVAEDDEPLV